MIGPDDDNDGGEMKRRIGSLFKNHSGGCTGGKREADCDCGWKGRYRHNEVTLARWLGEPVDPRSERAGEKALALLVSAVDEGRFSPRGFVRVSTEANFADFIEVYRARHVEKHGHTSTSIDHMLNVIKRSRLGQHTLQELAENPSRIEDWLDEHGRAARWKAVTWNKYHGLLHSIFKKAATWPVKHGRPRIPHNPIPQIETRRAAEPQHFKNRVLIEEVEDRLFAMVDQLNRVQHGPNTRGRLTMDQADAIRARVAAGERQKAVAADVGVSPSVVCAIVSGAIWNPAKYRVGTKGHEMRRRLIAAFDGGLRRGEMQALQVKHVNWRPIVLTGDDGVTLTAYEIKLPPELTKGGRVSGQPEVVYAVTERFRLMLDQRRLQLKNRPEAYLFGTEAGYRQVDFDRMWQALFTLAEIPYGRDLGVVWHQIRHEFCSRIGELTNDPKLAQELMRHHHLDTTLLYMKVRETRKIQALARLARHA
jgi:integrase